MANLFDNPQAFAPFFDERVTVSVTRREAGQPYTLDLDLAACVTESGFDEAFGSRDGGSDRPAISVHVRRKGPGAWPEFLSSPQPGDRIARADGSRYVVERVDLFHASVYILEARAA